VWVQASFQDDLSHQGRGVLRQHARNLIWVRVSWHAKLVDLHEYGIITYLPIYQSRATGPPARSQTRLMGSKTT
jgi:hypothetical protein